MMYMKSLENIENHKGLWKFAKTELKTSYEESLDNIKLSTKCLQKQQTA